MKPIIIYKNNEDNFIKFTEEELNEFVNNIYQNGFTDGKNSIVWCYPYQYEYLTPNKYNFDPLKVTWTASAKTEE